MDLSLMQTDNKRLSINRFANLFQYNSSCETVMLYMKGMVTALTQLLCNKSFIIHNQSSLDRSPIRLTPIPF